MQMRFDGHLGFPGGCADPGEDAVDALNREMSEESSRAVRLRVCDGDRVVSHWSPDKRLLLHFFALEVTPDRLARIERGVLAAHDFGGEVLGTVRVPLFTMSDGYRGFPSFLRNQFIGNSRQQLLHGLVAKGIMTKEEIREALSAQPVFFDGSKEAVAS
ncbi:hypothetical protein AAG570_007096 [Ranatra chinensis]|uniref:U8 snoRNA-decapping enzyme n=1 Tax=Ranatra chinensis TaxID=642074 RepID=A0ABD0XWU0_9HEMI